jgi:hypothetical protein
LLRCTLTLSSPAKNETPNPGTTTSGLDASSMGRWVSPDWSAKADPVPYSKLDDPQTLNLYAYVGNNPLANADPDGHACSVLLQNTGGGFCQRSDEYLKMDAQVNDKTRFFAATSAVSQALAGADAIGGEFAFSKPMGGFLETVGSGLERMNQQLIGDIKSGTLAGSDLDGQLVHMEQTKVQGYLDLASKSNPGFSDSIKEINAALNPTGIREESLKSFSHRQSIWRHTRRSTKRSWSQHQLCQSG